MSYESQQTEIMRLLISKPVVYLPEIRSLGIANHTARISELRAKGYDIENFKYKQDRKVFSEYRLRDSLEIVEIQGGRVLSIKKPPMKKSLKNMVREFFKK